MIQFLVEKKSPINQQNKNKETPLHLLCKNENVSFEIVEYLFKNKAHLNSMSNFGVIPLEFAFENPLISDDIIIFLIENKSDLNLLVNSFNDEFYWQLKLIPLLYKKKRKIRKN